MLAIHSIDWRNASFLFLMPQYISLCAHLRHPRAMPAPRNELLPTRVVLDICAALSDPELDRQERTIVALTIFYQDLSAMLSEHHQKAVEQCLHFIRGGDEEPPGRAPKLMDWEQDFQYIIAPINRVLGREVRSVEYMHWWTSNANTPARKMIWQNPGDSEGEPCVKEGERRCMTVPSPSPRRLITRSWRRTWLD